MDDNEITDLQLIDLYCEQCLEFISPKIFRQIKDRGLYNIINFLPHNSIEEAKAVARARMGMLGKYFNEPEIDEIAGIIGNLERLKKQLNDVSITDVDKILPLLNDMTSNALFVKNYFKAVKMPE